MRNALFAALGGLIFGTLATFAYDRSPIGSASLPKASIDISPSLAKATEDNQQARKEIDAMSAQIQELSSSNGKLRQQVAELKTSTASAEGTPPANPMAGIMKAAMAQQFEQKLLLLKSRLHLTPEQEEAVKAAMDAESKRAEAMTAKMFSGGKIDPQAMADLKGVKSVDQTLNDILEPDQKTAYQQMKTDQKNSAAETMASVEMNQVAPLLQLNDAQKDQVYSALCQAQVNEQDPTWIKNNVTNPTDPTAILDAQEKAKEDALSKVLTPDQLATFRQQMQSQLSMQKAMMQKMSPPTAAVVPATEAHP